MTRGSTTREAMAEVALRMFAERGIDAVSLREITAASGQRNKSAAQYHFGSKEQLVREIFERHTGQVNIHRQQLLTALYENGRQPSLEGLADALIHPLADTLIEHEHSHYARFLAQVATPPWTMALVPADPAATESVRTVFSEIVRLLDDLPEAVLRTRLALAMMLTVRALAACEHAMEGSGPDNERRVALLTANLIDSTIGILRAPVSDATRRLLPPNPERVTADDNWPWHFLVGAEAGF
ncbi:MULTISPECIES: helix-turn-helix domain-containing protein [unclassified Streptomyces]|uniref:TetR/AcrR family transcriptional regulator n=1 Tax=unclassified Streptomyces TaxID=2593676 RepID=UPI002E112EFA|nr:TetR/AcrR family transcriptional regulator [Streptomyces sp. NBC_01197]WSS52306.1 TetR/AcrR family transcriptional regulator [Streptomyces sp. NBC_01180]